MGRRKEEDFLVSRESSSWDGSTATQWILVSLSPAPGGLSAEKPHAGVPQTPRGASDTQAEHVLQCRVNFPFLPALPINWDLVGGAKPGNYPLFTTKDGILLPELCGEQAE